MARHTRGSRLRTALLRGTFYASWDALSLTQKALALGFRIQGISVSSRGLGAPQGRGESIFLVLRAHCRRCNGDLCLWAIHARGNCSMDMQESSCPDT